MWSSSPRAIPAYRATRSVRPGWFVQGRPNTRSALHPCQPEGVATPTRSGYVRAVWFARITSAGFPRTATVFPHRHTVHPAWFVPGLPNVRSVWHLWEKGSAARVIRSGSAGMGSCARITSARRHATALVYREEPFAWMVQHVPGRPLTSVAWLPWERVDGVMPTRSGFVRAPWCAWTTYAAHHWEVARGAILEMASVRVACRVRARSVRRDAWNWERRASHVGWLGSFDALRDWLACITSVCPLWFPRDGRVRTRAMHVWKERCAQGPRARCVVWRPWGVERGAILSHSGSALWICNVCTTGVWTIRLKIVLTVRKGPKWPEIGMKVCSCLDYECKWSFLRL